MIRRVSHFLIAIFLFATVHRSTMAQESCEPKDAIGEPIPAACSSQSDVAEEPLGEVNLFALKADPERPFVYASDAGRGKILVIDTTTEAVVDSVQVGELSEHPTDLVFPLHRPSCQMP